MKNSYTKLLNVCEAGEGFVKDYYSGNYSDNLLTILGCLINIEAVLDSGRAITLMDNQVDRKNVVDRMDDLRKEIRKIIDNSDKKEVHDLVYSKARYLETCWGNIN